MGIFIKAITRPILLTGAFAFGLAMFVRPWPIKPLSQRQNPPQFKLAADLETNQLFKDVSTDKAFKRVQAAELIPDAHKVNHVGQGLLNGPNHLDIGPLVYINKSKGEMVAFTRLGHGLTGSDGKVHNGIISTLLDELLCFCGFPKLPNKRGVTASLDIEFLKRAEPNSILVLNSKVVNHKGRKCVIEGDVKDLKNGELIARANCILVEPKWFKYLNWVTLF